MRHPVLVSVAAVALAGGVAGAGFARWGGPHGVSASRAAADRACEPAYVTAPIDPPGTTLPALRLVPFTTLEEPTALAFHPTGVAVIGQRTGEVFVLRGNRVDPDPALDLSGDTEDEGDGGLLGLAYSPEGDWLYVLRTDAGLDDVLTAYPVDGGVPDPAGEVTILTVDHPPNEMHHGGGLAFGPDGYLYVTTGDGGGLGDPRNNAQRLGTWLGKVLRIDPTPGARQPYTVPAGNPFADREGAKPEIFSFGLRNPFRLSFDRATGDLWIADVGQSCWEEIDYRPAGEQGGENFGWDRREGTHPFQGGPPGDHVLPIHDYSHLHGWCVIVGGFVYRGTAIPELDGAYLFTDFCKGAVVALRQRGGVRIGLEQLGVRATRPVALVEGPDGEPWVLSLEGGVSRIVPAAR